MNGSTAHVHPWAAAAKAVGKDCSESELASAGSQEWTKGYLS